MQIGKNNILFIVFLILMPLLLSILGFIYYLDSIKHIGMWNFELKVYDNDENLVRDEIINLELKENGTFVYTFTNELKKDNDFEITGTYYRNRKTINLSYDDDYEINDTFYLKNDKLFFYKDNNNKCLIKENIYVLEIPEIYNEISYDEYLKLLSNKEKAIVVIGNDGCSYCVKYKNQTLTDIYSINNTKLYHVNSDGNWDNLELKGTPTTHFLKNGEVINNTLGYIDYEEFVTIMKNIGY